MNRDMIYEEEEEEKQEYSPIMKINKNILREKLISKFERINQLKEKQHKKEAYNILSWAFQNEIQNHTTIKILHYMLDKYLTYNPKPVILSPLQSSPNRSFVKFNFNQNDQISNKEGQFNKYIAIKSTLENNLTRVIPQLVLKYTGKYEEAEPILLPTPKGIELLPPSLRINKIYMYNRFQDSDSDTSSSSSSDFDSSIITKLKQISKKKQSRQKYQNKEKEKEDEEDSNIGFSEDQKKQLYQVFIELKQFQKFLTMKLAFEKIHHKRIVQNIFLKYAQIRANFDLKFLTQIQDIIKNIDRHHLAEQFLPFCQVQYLNYLWVKKKKNLKSGKYYLMNVLSHEMQSLKEINYDFTSETSEKIIFATLELSLEKKPFLESLKLDFSRCNLGIKSENFQEMEKILSRLRSLKHLSLNLSDNCLGSDNINFEKFGNLLQKFTKIESLDLNLYNDISNQDQSESMIEVFNSFFEKAASNLTSLKLNLGGHISCFSRADMKKLAKGISNLNLLKELCLHISHCGFDNSEDFLLPLAEGVGKKNLVKTLELDITFNFVSDNLDYFTHMAQFLSNFPSVENLTLNLGDTLLEFSQETIVLLAQGTQNMKELKNLKLDLHSNRLGVKEGSMKYLGELIKGMRFLESLHLILDDNLLCFDSDNVRYLGEAIKEFDHIKDIALNVYDKKFWNKQLELDSECLSVDQHNSSLDLNRFKMVPFEEGVLKKKFVCIIEDSEDMKFEDIPTEMQKEYDLDFCFEKYKILKHIFNSHNKNKKDNKDNKNKDNNNKDKDNNNNFNYMGVFKKIFLKYFKREAMVNLNNVNVKKLPSQNRLRFTENLEIKAQELFKDTTTKIEKLNENLGPQLKNLKINLNTFKNFEQISIKPLMSALSEIICRRLSILNLDIDMSQSMISKGIEHLKIAIKGSQVENLKLNLAFNQLVGKNISNLKSLGYSLLDLENLKSLDLNLVDNFNKSNYCKEAFEVFFSFLGKMGNLTCLKLNLGHNCMVLSRENMQQLGKALGQLQKLKEVNLGFGYCLFEESSDCLRPLGEGIGEMKSVLKLDLDIKFNYFYQGDEYVRDMTEFLARFPMVQCLGLGLRDTRVCFREETIQYLARGTQNMKDLKDLRLDLSQNELGLDNDNLKYLSVLLKSMAFLEFLELNLKGNNLCKEVQNYKYLVEIFKVLNGLKERKIVLSEDRKKEGKVEQEEEVRKMFEFMENDVVF